MGFGLGFAEGLTMPATLCAGRGYSVSIYSFVFRILGAARPAPRLSTGEITGGDDLVIRHGAAASLSSVLALAILSIAGAARHSAEGCVSAYFVISEGSQHSAKTNAKELHP